MNPMKAAILSFLMLSAVAMGGIGFYSTQAVADHSPIEGYGITASSH